MKKSSLFLLLFGLVVSASAQKGTLTGIVSEPAENGSSPVPFANVVLAGTSVGASTDFDGRYSLDLDAGTYDIVFSYVGYGADTLRGIPIESGVTRTLSHTMKGSTIQMNAFEVIVEQDRERETVLLMDRKESTDLVQNIGARELAKKGASDVAEGVQKVVGLSVVGGRYVYVRGLGDRYNSAYLNGMPLPSPDPDAKVAPLDIFPTKVVSSISVNKAFTPELYGDFSGGAVDIRTKQATEENTLQLSVGGGMNTQSTFRTGKTYSGGANDFWGFDDGTRALPPSFKSGDPLAGDRVLPFAQNFNPVENKQRPDFNFGLFGANSMKLGEKNKLNFLFTANYKNETRYRTGKNRIVNNQNAALIDYDVESYKFNTQTSGLGTVNLELGKQHEITFNSLYVNLSSDQHRENYGYHFDYENEVYARRFTFRQNNVWVNQLQGRHGFGIDDRLQVTWDVSYSKANSDEPDRRQLVYLRNPETDVYNFNAIDRIENHRWFSELVEDEQAVGGSAKYRLKETTIDEEIVSLFSMKVGVQAKRKNRDFGYRIFSYRLEDIVGDNPQGLDPSLPDVYLDQDSYLTGDFFIQEATGPEATHFIRQEINAAYMTADVAIIPKKLNVLGGARIEDGSQRVIYRNNFDSEIDPYRVALNNSLDVLPFINVKYDMTKENVLRASASKTISRPGFREMAPFEYTEFFAGTKNVGNPNLVNGTNYNADVRFERYPAPGELFSVGVFGKRLEDPIEKVALASASGQLQSFRNTGTATVAGIELEYVKNIGRIFRTDSTLLNDFSIGLNTTVLTSSIDLSKTSTGNGPSQVVTNETRPLQGASPYLINADLSYTKQLSDNLKGVVTVAYNVYGRRVVAAGENGLGDQYELPLNTLNLVVRAEIGDKWQLSLKGVNLLDAEYRVEQETPEGTALINSFRTGTSMSFGLTYRLY
jgi:TonB-dependent receptor